MRPRGGVGLYVLSVFFCSMIGTLVAVFYDVSTYWADGRGFHLLIDIGVGILFGLVVGLAATFNWRLLESQVSFDGNEELFKKVVEIAVSGAGHEVVYEGDALLVWMRTFQPDVFKWGVRVQIEGNTATILGPVPLALRLKNTIEVASLVAKWTLLFASEAQVA